MRTNTCPKCGCDKDKRSQLCQECRKATFVCDNQRICTKCGQTKSLSEFRIRTRKTPRPRSVCKECEAQRQRNRPTTRRLATRKWEQSHPELFKLQKLRHRCRMIGFDESLIAPVAEYLTNVKQCEICGRTIENAGQQHKHSLCIDHDHKTGQFRGALCSRCNTGLGYFCDNPDLFRAAIAYLSRPNVLSSHTQDQDQV